MTFNPAREKSVLLVPIPKPKGYEETVDALKVYFPKFTEIMKMVTSSEPRTKELSDVGYYLISGINRQVKVIFGFYSCKIPVLPWKNIQQTIYIFSKESCLEFSKLDLSEGWSLIEGNMFLSEINVMKKLIESFLWEWQYCGYLDEIDFQRVREIRRIQKGKFLYDAFDELNRSIKLS